MTHAQRTRAAIVRPQEQRVQRRHQRIRIAARVARHVARVRITDVVAAVAAAGIAPHAECVRGVCLGQRHGHRAIEQYARTVQEFAVAEAAHRAGQRFAVAVQLRQVQLAGGLVVLCVCVMGWWGGVSLVRERGVMCGINLYESRSESCARAHIKHAHTKTNNTVHTQHMMQVNVICGMCVRVNVRVCAVRSRKSASI